MASGDHLFTLYARASMPTQSAAALPGIFSDGSTIIGSIPCLDYLGATEDTHAEWLVTIPDAYAGGGFDISVVYGMDGTVGAAVQFEIRSQDLIDADVISSQNLQAQTLTDITDTPIGTANTLNITVVAAITHANAGSPAIGGQQRFRVSRDFNHAANADLAKLLAVVITET